MSRGGGIAFQRANANLCDAPNIQKSGHPTATVVAHNQKQIHS